MEDERTPRQNGWSIGSVIAARWLLLDYLDHGGSTEIYRVRHTITREIAALKVMRPLFAGNSELGRRMIEEARALGTLHKASSSFVRVLDAGIVENRVYIVMDLLEGKDLRKVLRDECPIPVDRALFIMVEVVQALAVAHEHHIIHRDLKPDNVFVTYDEKVKILDFGIAKYRDFGVITKEGTTLGTVPYMPPEQQDPDQEVDERADLFAVGMMFDELLRGHHVFAHDRVRWFPEHKIRQCIREAEVPPVSLVRPDVPKEVCRIIQRAVQKDRRARYQTAAEMARDLVVARLGTRAGNGNESVSAPSSFTRDSERPGKVPLPSSPTDGTRWVSRQPSRPPFPATRHHRIGPNQVVGGALVLGGLAGVLGPVSYFWTLGHDSVPARARLWTSPEKTAPAVAPAPSAAAPIMRAESALAAAPVQPADSGLLPPVAESAPVPSAKPRPAPRPKRPSDILAIPDFRTAIDSTKPTQAPEPPRSSFSALPDDDELPFPGPRRGSSKRTPARETSQPPPPTEREKPVPATEPHR